MEKEHQYLQNKDFVILSSGFWNNTVKRKTFETLWIKNIRPTLNRQEKSIKLKLLNQSLFKKCLTVEFCVIYKPVNCITVQIVCLVSILHNFLLSGIFLTDFNSFWDGASFL